MMAKTLGKMIVFLMHDRALLMILKPSAAPHCRLPLKLTP